MQIRKIYLHSINSVSQISNSINVVPTLDNDLQIQGRETLLWILEQGIWNSRREGTSELNTMIMHMVFKILKMICLVIANKGDT